MKRTLEMLVAQWGDIVSNVERGYTLTFDDYLNDVDLRNSIAQRARDDTGTSDEPTSVQTMASLLRLLDAIDARFIASTREVRTCVWGEANARDEGWTREREWWYYREPVALRDGDQLMPDND
jgi:hypothetical protein